MIALLASTSSPTWLIGPAAFAAFVLWRALIVRRCTRCGHFGPPLRRGRRCPRCGNDRGRGLLF